MIAGTAGWIRTTDLLIHSFIVKISLSFLAFPVYARPLPIGRFLPTTDSCSFLQFPLRWFRGGSLKRDRAVFGRRPPRTYPVICCFGLWLTDCRPTGWVISTMRAGICSIVRACLRRNRFYIGEVAFKAEVLKGEQPAILDTNLFEARPGQAE
jgi:hypothetical protein